MEKKEVVLYARTSTQEQNTDTQILTLRDYCKRMEYNITDEYIDNGFSGKNTQRPQFERLLDDMRQGKIKTIIVYKLDRIGRSLKHLLNLFEEFENKKIDFVSITQNIDTSTPTGKFFFTILGAVAEFERETIVERIRTGLDRAKKEGKLLGRKKGAKDSKRRCLSGYYMRWQREKVGRNRLRAGVNNPPLINNEEAVKAYVWNFQNK